MVAFLKIILEALFMNDFLKIITAALLSAGLTYWFGIRKLYTETKLKFKTEKYSVLIKSLSNFFDNDSSEHNLLALNEALFFASDNVVREIQKFNKLYTAKQSEGSAEKKETHITSEDLKPLIKAIRTELNLESDSIDEGELRFFQKPKK
jgi:hypothetical protein